MFPLWWHVLEHVALFFAAECGMASTNPQESIAKSTGSREGGSSGAGGGGGDNTAVLLSRFQATSKPTVSHIFYWLLPNCITGCKWGTGLWIVACCQTLEKNLLNNAVRPPLMSTRLPIQFPLCCKLAQWVWQRKVHQKKKLTFN